MAECKSNLKNNLADHLEKSIQMCPKYGVETAEMEAVRFGTPVSTNRPTVRRGIVQWQLEYGVTDTRRFRLLPYIDDNFLEEWGDNFENFNHIQMDSNREQLPDSTAASSHIEATCTLQWQLEYGVTDTRRFRLLPYIDDNFLEEWGDNFENFNHIQMDSNREQLPDSTAASSHIEATCTCKSDAGTQTDVNMDSKMNSASKETGTDETKSTKNAKRRLLNRFQKLKKSFSKL